MLIWSAANMFFFVFCKMMYGVGGEHKYAYKEKKREKQKHNSKISNQDIDANENNASIPLIIAYGEATIVCVCVSVYNIHDVIAYVLVHSDFCCHLYGPYYVTHDSKFCSTRCFVDVFDVFDVHFTNCCQFQNKQKTTKTYFSVLQHTLLSAIYIIK